MKKLPYGISDYEKIIENNYYYVDKTQYIEKLEDYANPTIMFLRPRKFGKTLFTSVLENYYDINKKDKFEKLFGNTYIGKHPTKEKNNYHILRFNFSSLDTSSTENTIESFKSEVARGVKKCVELYELNFYVNLTSTAEDILKDFFTAFSIQKSKEKIYIIIDEYDHFANELLSFDIDNFKHLVSRNGKVRKWYEALKIGTESVVGRIFITGVAPITLDSLTSGFNIASNITMDRRFNCMMGFTEKEIQEIMKDQKITKAEQEKLLPLMKENYDGYKFILEEEKEGIYNSNMCLYFFSEYTAFKEIPQKLVDVNIASDYKKIGNMLNLYKGKEKVEIIKQTLSDEGFISSITQQFNPAREFTQTDLISMLFYLGYLTLNTDDIRDVRLVVPNNVMKKIYAEYFLIALQEETNAKIETNYEEISREMALYGKIDKITELTHTYLSNLSNRDYQNFKEVDVKIMFYTIAMLLTDYTVKSEMEINRKYMDLLLIPKDNKKEYNSILIEFKYLKKANKKHLEETKQEAREQIQEYAKLEEIQEIKNLNMYTVVAVNDKLYVEKIEN